MKEAYWGNCQVFTGAFSRKQSANSQITHNSCFKSFNEIQYPNIEVTIDFYLLKTCWCRKRKNFNCWRRNRNWALIDCICHLLPGNRLRYEILLVRVFPYCG